MRDITSELGLATSRPAPKGAALKFALRHLQLGSPTVVDWDEGAGEHWARIMIEEATIALVSMTRPFIIAITSSEAVATLVDLDASADSMVTIAIASTGAPLLCSTASAIAAFAGREISPALDVRKFSADDLMWATL